MPLKKVVSKLESILGEKNVSVSDIDKIAYSKDTTLITLNWALQGKLAGVPDIITWPETAEQISQILK